MRLPVLLTTIPSRITTAMRTALTMLRILPVMSRITKRLRRQTPTATVGMRQIEIPPPMEIAHQSEDLDTAETKAPTQAKKRAITGAAAVIIVILVVVMAIIILPDDDKKEQPALAPITISLPVEMTTPTTLPTIEPNQELAPITIAPPPAPTPTLAPPPTLTPTPLPPTPTLPRQPTQPTYTPPTATPPPPPTPRNLVKIGNPPHVVCVKYTLNDLPQADVSVRIVDQRNQSIMLARAVVTDKKGTACLQVPITTLGNIAVPVVSGWNWERVDGEAVLRGDTNVMTALEVKRCTGSQGHLPVIRASGELKCPYKR